MRVGYIGLGDIGTPIAEQLLRGEAPLTLWNRTAAKMEPFIEAGAIAVSSPRTLADCVDIVVLCLDTDSAVEEVLLGESGVASASQRPRVVVDHSTIHPARTAQIGRELAERGISFVDAPVSGGAAGAQRGDLAIFLGGAKQDVELVLPIVRHYGAKISHVGPLGAGQVVKACNQLINFCSVAAIAEAIALAEAAGLEARRLPEFLEGGFADSNMLREYARGAATGDKAHMTGLIETLVTLFHGKFAELHQPPAMPIKDVGIILHLARSSGCSVPMISLADNLYRLLDGQRLRSPGNAPAPVPAKEPGSL